MKHCRTALLLACCLAAAWLPTLAPLTVARAQEAAASSSAAHQDFVFAYRLLQRGDDDMAREAFDEFLGRFPGDEKRGDALYYRALLERKAGRNAKAAEFLKDMPATKLVPDHAVALLRGQVHYDLGQFDEAARWLEQINLQSLDPAVQSSVLYLRGLAYRGQNKLPAAQAQLQQVAGLDSPLKARALVDLGKVLALQNKSNEAIAALEQAIPLGDPQASAEAAHVAGDLAYQAGAYDKAIAFYRIVITNHTTSPHYGPAIVGLMWAQFQARQFANVLASFEQFRENMPAPQRVTAWYLAASAQQELGQHEQAVATLRAVLTGATGSDMEDKVLYKLAVSQSALGQYDAMAQTVDRLLKQHASSPLRFDVEFLLAAADAKRGDPARGAARLTAIIDAGKDHPYFQQALLQRARLYEANNQLAPAAEDYQRVLQEAAAKPNLVSAASLYEASLRLVDLRQRLEQYEPAAQVVAALLARPNLPPLVQQQALYRQALVQIKLNKPQEALASLNELLTKHPQNAHLAEARYYRGLLLMSLNKPDEAVVDLQAAALTPSLPDPLKVNAMRLASARLREKGQSKPAAELLLAMEKLVGLQRMTSDELIWLGEYQMNEVKDAESPRAALRYLKPILEGKSTAGGEQRAEALLLVAQALRQLNDSDAAVQAFRQVVAMGEGHDLEARLELARTLRQAGKVEDALAEYAGLIIAPQTPIASEALFQSAMIQRELAVQRQRASDNAGADTSRGEARKMLKRLVLLYSFPELSPLPELAYLHLSELAVASGNTAAAMLELRDLIEKYPDTPYAAYAKAMLLALENKRSEAIFLLKELRKGKDLDARLIERLDLQLRALESTP